MDVVVEDLLFDWIGRAEASAAPTVHSEGLRFAFYGRVSTASFQERSSSRRWQRDVAEDLIAGRGGIVAEFFDVSRSRRLPWRDRPQAAALLAAVADPGRGFDAVVVGEYERAFCGDQLLTLAPVFEAYGVQLWLPELHGRLDLHDASHQALIMLLRAQSRREVLRARWRALRAMQAQTRDEGRFLGGRPPFGYRLVDAGPHPNPMHASWGRRLQRLDPDPVTAPVVRAIFAERLTGRSVAGIAAALNERGVPCASAADGSRHRHQATAGWATTTVRSILGNAKYTGRQVWNRQPARYTPSHLPGRFRTQCWVRPDQWVVSARVAHPALVSEADFVAVQQLTAGSSAGRGVAHCYQLAGRLRCGRCGRAFESCWSHGRPAYRCRHGQTSARPRNGRKRNLYVREDRIIMVLRGLMPDCGEGPSAAQLADYLRQMDLVLLCTEAACTLEPA